MTKPGGIVFTDPDPYETMQILVSGTGIPAEACARVAGGDGWVQLQVPLPLNVLLVTTGMRWGHNRFDRIVRLGDLTNCFFANNDLERIEAHDRTPTFPNLPRQGWWSTRISTGYLIGTMEELKRNVGDRLTTDLAAVEPPTLDRYGNNPVFVDGLEHRFLAEVATMAAMGITRPEGLLVVPAILLLMADLLELPDRYDGAEVVTKGPWIGLRFGSTAVYAAATDGSWTVNVGLEAGLEAADLDMLDVDVAGFDIDPDLGP
jgi:hypothetical protein